MVYTKVYKFKVLNEDGEMMYRFCIADSIEEAMQKKDEYMKEMYSQGHMLMSAVGHPEPMLVNVVR